MAAGLPSDPVRKLDETIFALNLDRQSLVDNHSCLLSPAAILHLAEKEEKQEADRETEKRHDELPLEKAVVVRQDYGTNALTYVQVHVLGLLSFAPFLHRHAPALVCVKCLISSCVAG